MNPINVNSKTAFERLDFELALVQLKTKVREIEADDIFYALKIVDNELCISKKAKYGVTVSVDCNAQKFPNCYKFIPYSTHFSAKYTSKGWTVTNIYRGECRRPTKAILVNLTDRAKEAIIQSKMNFEIY